MWRPILLRAQYPSNIPAHSSASSCFVIVNDATNIIGSLESKLSTYFGMCLSLLLLCSCRYAWIAAIWATATKRWRSTWAPPFSIAQTTTGQRLFHLPLTDLLDATGRRRPSSFSAYSPSCRLRRQFENKKKDRRSCCQISRQAKMPYQDVWKIIWKKKPAGNFKFVFPLFLLHREGK